MSHTITAIGSEYVYSTDLDGVTLTVGVYNDSTDNVARGDDIGDLTTEPTNANYSPHDDTFSLANPSGNDVVIRNDSDFVLDFTDQGDEHWVDSYYVSAVFQASLMVGDSEPVEHLIWTGEMTTDRELGSIDNLNINANDAELDLTTLLS